MEEFEALLRQFQPRRPAPLPNRPHRRAHRAGWIAAAAGIAAAIAIVVVRMDKAPPATEERVESVTLGTLTAQAMANPDDFDEGLTRLSLVTLPDVEQTGGALAQLAKE